MSRLWEDVRGDLVGKALGTGHRIPDERLRLRDLTRKLPEKPTCSRQVPAAVRWAVWERDNFTCLHCGSRRFLSLDHKIPWSKGGTHDQDNLQTLCRTCNSRKRTRYQL